MQFFTQSEATAARRRVILYLVDATDGISAEPGEAGGQPQLSKAGAAWANTTATLTAIGNGAYYVELTAAELDTLGTGAVRYKSANTAEANVPIQVLAADLHNGTSLGLARLDATVGSRASQASLDVVDDFLDTEVAAIQAKTDQLVFTNPGKVDAAVLAAGDFAQGAADKAWSTAARALTDKAGFSLSPAGVQAIWDALTSALTTVGSIGKRIADFLTGDAFARLGAPAGASVSADVAAVKAQTGAIETDTQDLQARVPAALIGGRMDTSVGAMQANVMTAAAADPSLASEFADQVWDEPMAEHLSAGSTGASLNGAGAAGDPWTAALPGAYGAGTAGNILGNRLDAAITSRLAAAGYSAPDNAGIAAIQAAVDTEVAAILAAVDTEVAAIKAKTDQLVFSGGRVDAVAGAIDASVQAALVAAIFARTFGANYQNRTFDELVKVIVAAMAGKSSGVDTGAPKYRNLADNADVISAVASNGNRTSVTLTP